MQQCCKDPKKSWFYRISLTRVKAGKKKKGDEISPGHKSYFGNCPRGFGANGHVHENLKSRTSRLVHYCGLHVYTCVHIHLSLAFTILVHKCVRNKNGNLSTSKNVTSLRLFLIYQQHIWKPNLKIFISVFEFSSIPHSKGRFIFKSSTVQKNVYCIHSLCFHVLFYFENY